MFGCWRTSEDYHDRPDSFEIPHLVKAGSHAECGQPAGARARRGIVGRLYQPPLRKVVPSWRFIKPPTGILPGVPPHPSLTLSPAQETSDPSGDGYGEGGIAGAGLCHNAQSPAPGIHLCIEICLTSIYSSFYF
jgi:hypothetical protein